MSNDNHQESFIRKYIFSIDHKWIGIQYGVTSMIFLLFGFVLMMIMRYQSTGQLHLQCQIRLWIGFYHMDGMLIV